MWQVGTTEAFDAWFADLGATAEGREAQVEIDASLHVLREVGPSLGRPAVDTLKGSKHANLKELRASTGRMVIRIVFAFDPLQMAILLIGGDKSGVSQKRFYKQLIKRADLLYDAHLDDVRKVIEARKSADKAKQREARGKAKRGKKGG